MCTLANATALSLEIWRAAAPDANGLSTRSTCGPLAILSRVLVIRALVAGAVTSSAANTTWFVSVASESKLSVSRFSAVVDSVPGNENESVNPDPALALRPPSDEQRDHPDRQDAEFVPEAPAGECGHRTDSLRGAPVVIS